ncbi:PolC-type DNA polymerase III N-terminal domain-containing protein [Streptococcus vestibularis]|uniref:DNA polymerase III PolC n=1 Tax=Streptococcus vestibularis ATCC 49124 TaxID=889206 RepID=A0ABP2KGA2_STRVE|nr:PolC-type DNA polymerase III N-terminal domain-containing protein [Streptococcus vestibularis]EFX95286.1 DNA polymerase III PolC [Streptococcus vestibularis ATCC 49124]
MFNKFQLLLKQIRFPEDHDAFKEIKDGSIETVKLFKSKRQWFFVFLFLVFCLMSLLLFLIVYFILPSIL